MNFTPEVVAALAVLRNAAKNDFERHRLDVLERDLINPPVVEIIDDKHQKFDGLIFPKIKSGHYSNHSFPIHRAVWTYFNGEIPQGYEIHHLDNNPSNNDIKNLVAMSAYEHKRLHWKHYPEKIHICQFCGKVFTTKSPHPAKFCSIKCSNGAKQKAAKKRNAENRICIICGKEFSANRYTKTKACSPHCGATLAARTLRIRKQNLNQQSLFASPDNHCDNEPK